MLIAILNQSSLVSDADVTTMTHAVATQVRLDVAPLWDRTPPEVVFYTDPAAVPAMAHGIAIVDTIADQPKGVDGYHTEEHGGKLWGAVAVKPELDNGGQVSTGDWSVSSVLSHEVLEMFVDPKCNMWANDDKGSTYSFEVCDPVEAPSYVVNGVSVCNFVTPAWFDPMASENSQFDKLGQLSAPFSILAGGYMVYTSGGQEHQEFGKDFPEWRKQMKTGPVARARRRMNQASYRTAITDSYRTATAPDSYRTATAPDASYRT